MSCVCEGVWVWVCECVCVSECVSVCVFERLKCVSVRCWASHECVKINRLTGSQRQGTILAVKLGKISLTLLSLSISLIFYFPPLFPLLSPLFSFLLSHLLSPFLSPSPSPLFSPSPSPPFSPSPSPPFSSSFSRLFSLCMCFFFYNSVKLLKTPTSLSMSLSLGGGEFVNMSEIRSHPFSYIFTLLWRHRNIFQACAAHKHHCLPLFPFL